MHPRVEELKRDLIALMAAVIAASRDAEALAAVEAMRARIDAALLSAEVRS